MGKRNSDTKRRYDHLVLFAQRFSATREEDQGALGIFDESLALRVDDDGVPIVLRQSPAQLGTVTKAQKDPADFHDESRLAFPTRADKDRDSFAGQPFLSLGEGHSLRAFSSIPKTSGDKDRDRGPSVMS